MGVRQRIRRNPAPPPPANDRGAGGSRLFHLLGRGQRRQRRPRGVVPAVPTDQAEQLAVEVPELVLRNEPTHREAFIHLGPGGQIEPAQWQLISQSLHGWVEEHAALPSELGARVTYLADPTTAENQGPDCDFAIPIT
jgi:hypothetical protein